MKRTLRVLGLLIVAAGLFFTSCKMIQDAINKASNPDLEEALFDESKLTEDAAKIELTSGSWIYRSNTVKDGETIAQQIDFSVDSNNKVKENYTYRIYADGEYKEYTSAEIANSANDDDEYLAAAFLSGLQLAAFEIGMSIENGKTNSDKSKFYWTNANSNGGTNKYWLEKD